MIIGKLQTTLRSTHATRCILTLLTLATLGLAARAQQPAVASATAHRVATASAAAAAPKPGPVGEEAETPAANDAAHQGIHVHGHWVLQVKNPDGTLGERREFENSLVTTYYTYNGQYVYLGCCPLGGGDGRDHRHERSVHRLCQRHIERGPQPMVFRSVPGRSIH